MAEVGQRSTRLKCTFFMRDSRLREGRASNIHAHTQQSHHVSFKYDATRVFFPLCYFFFAEIKDYSQSEETVG